MTNLTDLTVDSLVSTTMTIGSQDLPAPTSQAMTADGAITIKHGVVSLSKAGVLAATLAAPTATTDDFKRLVIVSLTAQLHTVTPVGGLGGGATVATASGVIGDTLELIAYQGVWYVAGFHQYTFA